MVEHVGSNQIDEYARVLARLLEPGGRLLNHGIARLRHGDAEAGPFSERYVFPDAAPLHLSRIQLALERAGFEHRHVEGLRQDYVDTLSAWIDRLDANREAAERAGGRRAACASGGSTCAPPATAFATGFTSIYQVLAPPLLDGASRAPGASPRASRPATGDCRLRDRALRLREPPRTA